MSERKKIFVLVSRVPFPLEKGDKLRAYHQIKGLAKDHDVYLVALTDQNLHPEAMETLQTFCKEVYVFRLRLFQIVMQLLRGYFSAKPYQVNYFFNRRIKRKVNQIIAEIEPDRIYCQLIRMAEYVKHINTIPKTIDYMDAFSKGIERRIKTSPWFMRDLFKQEYPRLKNYEHLMYHYFEHHTIISEQDREFIAHEENEKIYIVPNGVDTDFFKAYPAEKKYDLVFTGNMNYSPNIDCAVYIVEKILPLVKVKFPGITLLISGAQPSARVKALASENITVTGWVSDIRESFAHSKIFLAPMQIGTGLQNKFLEAMSMSLPCITSPLANHALGAPENTTILVGYTAREIADHVIDLIEHPEKSERLARNGHQFVLDNFSWETHNKKLENIILSGKP